MPAEPYRLEFRAMASPCEIVLISQDQPAARRGAPLAVAEVQRIERKYSRFDPDSVIGRINARAASAAVDLDEETAALLAYAGQLWQLSDGLFDITTGALQGVWDFRLGRAPEPERLEQALQGVGWSKVRIDEAGIRFDHPGVRIDLGGFGKEYAADRAGAVLASLGMVSGYVNLGGDVRVLGPKPDGDPWVMGIRHPRRVGELIASIPVHGGALATSGDYERYFESGGRRYCHILSPLTGQPASRWQSISVLAPLATTAGATTTVAMLKEEGALEFLQASRLGFLAIDLNGEIFTHQSEEP